MRLAKGEIAAEVTRSFVRKTVDLPDALRERLHQRTTPTEGRKGRGFLIGLFIGLSEKLERGIGWRNIFPHRDHELDVALAWRF